MSVFRHLTTVLVGAAASTALLVVPAAAASPSASAEPGVASVQKTVVELTNAERAKVGCPALKIRPALHKAAQRHSADMAKHDFVGHTGSGGSTMVSRVEAAGYTGWSSLAENVAADQATAKGVVKGWMRSPGHRANILNCSLRHIGVGHVKKSGAGQGDYWTQDFGAKL
ncbi:CAP domain-containing protein [Streptomyces sp. NPDC056479]|uniref:CAP domain-containing protein n=1 Tax=unclassified Streptomyces TaxID=2593676 RepID=UPI003699D7B7